MSVFKRNGGWAAKFQLRGELHWVPGGPWQTKSAAREAERRHREHLDAHLADETCASFASRWLREWPRPATSTQRIYSYGVGRFADDFGGMKLTEVERLTARTWALGVPRNVSRVVGIMFEDARNIGLVEHNPFSNLRLPASERTQEVHPPSLEEFRQLLEACTVLGGYGAEFRAMIQFSAWTGVRAGELHALRWDDIGEDTIWIRRARKRDGEIGRPKNGKEREIAYLEPARVLDQVARRTDGFVFHSPRGNALVQGSHHYAWRTVRAASRLPFERQQAALPNVRWHDLRHFCATQLLELGLDHFAVSVQLGHEDGGALVMSRYGHPSKDAARTRLLDAFSARSRGGQPSTAERESLGTC